MEVQDYSEKSFAVFGSETKTHKEKLKELGGKFNASLKCGPGWIFPMARKKDVLAFIEGRGNSEESKVVSRGNSSAGYSVSTAGSSQSANIVAVFKAEIEKKNFQERIQLLSLLTGIASNTPVLVEKESKSSPPKKVSPKVKSALDSEDSDEEEDEDAFRPSFLTKKKN